MLRSEDNKSSDPDQSELVLKNTFENIGEKCVEDAIMTSEKTSSTGKMISFAGP